MNELTVLNGCGKIEMVQDEPLTNTINIKWNWQPIETAPRNETRILIAGYDEHDKKMHVASAYWHASAYGNGLWTDSSGEYSTAAGSPTHWMPLPDSPSEE
jgi:hypothetical protein